jgi:DNA-binding NtrC family response regulator
LFLNSSCFGQQCLLIEDDAIMGESLAQRFELEGFRVRWSRSLLEAEQHLTQPPSSVISDVRLPDGLATEWFLQLPAHVRSVPWFFLTGYGSVNDAIAAIRAGAKEYLTKPFDIEKLVAMVQNTIADEPIHTPEVVLGVSAAIRRALDRCEGSVTKTAELLGISRKTLWEKMKRLSIAA